MDNFVSFLLAAAIIVITLLVYLRKEKKVAAQGRAAVERGKQHSGGPSAQHPHIDATYCIGCAACTLICPEGDVLAMVGGKAVIANGHKCIGHSLCADVCPVGAITMVMASPSVGQDLPYLTSEQETSVENLFIAGELSGLALIKNAINQGKGCVDTMAARLAAAGGSRPAGSDLHDVLIIGAGPAGISASLRCIEKKLNYITLDEGEMGGTVAKYPRQKLVMTSPVEVPVYGKFKKTQLSKEELLALWSQVVKRVDFKFRSGERVQDIKKGPDGVFTVTSTKAEYRARFVILAIGKGGNPRKLGVKGEELPKVMYRLIEADHYVNKNILVVGGGDSAVEAAMGLAHQVGNKVTLSYRQASFSRIKERNTQRLDECVRKAKLTVLMESTPVEITADAVVMNVKGGATQNLPNDFVWVFAGGEPPTTFLKKVGIHLGPKDLTAEGSQEAQKKVEVAASLA